ncbi:MAG: LysM peptidoglycan-binding domain-containing protein [Gammaproteobacteria bacterium]|jgi:nucleoid-associated protein YgaU
MKTTKTLKLTSVMALVLTVAVGCSSTSEQGTSSEQAAKEAIAAAKAAYAKALKADWAWRDTGKMIKKAEKDLAAGKYDEAIKIANKARDQGNFAVAQKAEEHQRLASMYAADAAGTATPMAATPSANTYSVVKGDNLWNISAKPGIYNNPYEWPLIYKANSAKIKDADLIYPGQVFNINTNPSSADVAAAVHHAKTRGAWTLGKVEASDKAYLAGK